MNKSKNVNNNKLSKLLLFSYLTQINNVVLNDLIK